MNVTDILHKKIASRTASFLNNQRLKKVKRVRQELNAWNKKISLLLNVPNPNGQKHSNKKSNYTLKNIGDGYSAYFPYRVSGKLLNSVMQPKVVRSWNTKNGFSIKITDLGFNFDGLSKVKGVPYPVFLTKPSRRWSRWYDNDYISKSMLYGYKRIKKGLGV